MMNPGPVLTDAPYAWRIDSVQAAAVPGLVACAGTGQKNADSP